MVTVPPPGGMPVTSPVVGLTATAPLGLVHVPPVGVALSVTVSFTHTAVGPTNAEGNWFTVSVSVR